MGRVYRAFDPDLGRPVAIKILPPELVNDPDRMDRFVREARTASATNHPNVVTIYEIGSAEKTQFIAMELLDGETLRERGKLELRRAVEIMAQVADGVAAAHAAGVIHRDLKPENIVITKSGFAKILDFGLAKLRETPQRDDGATAKRTDPGTVMGSAGYMSPEQAAGRPVDHRTDIFSLGCILYESISGRRAFAGESSIDTLHKIIHDDPLPLRDLAPDLPPELQRIVRKSLAKDPDERYKSAKDLAIDLRSAKREIETQPHSVGPASAGPRSRTALWITPAVMALAIVAALIVIPRLRKAPASASAPMSITRITASGNVIGAAVSPDGEYVVYAYSDAGKHSLWVRQLATGSTLQLVPPSQIGLWGMAFSPDSRSVYYAVKSGADPAGVLYQISILGGSSRRLLAPIDSSVSFSPDGKRMAFTRGNAPAPGQSQLVIANADGSGERALITKTPPNYFVPIFWGAPSWSPDGKWISSPLHSGSEFTVDGVSVDDGSEKKLSNDKWGFVGNAVWLPDMSGLIAIGAAAEDLHGTHQLWLLAYPGGSRRPITNDLFDYRTASLSADGKSLVSVAADQTSGVWSTPLAGNAAAKKLTAGKYDGLQGVAAATDGFVFTSLDGGKWDLFSGDPAGNNLRELTSGSSQVYTPAISPDGKFVVFSMPRERDWALVRINRDGSGQKVLCTLTPVGRSGSSAAFTPDSRFVVFESAPGGVDRLWKVSIDGGQPAALPFENVTGPSISPDGKWIAYWAVDKICIAPLAGGPPVHTFGSISGNSFSLIRWMPDGKAILHSAGLNDRKNVWLQPIDGSQARPATHFDDQYILAFDVAPGGKELTVVRGVLSRDAVLIKNFR